MQKLAVLFILVFPLSLLSEEFNFPTKVKLAGELEKRVRLTEKRLSHHPFDVDLVVQDVARIPEKKRRFEEYEGDVSGRILGSWSYMSRLLDEHPEKLDQIFQQILKYQDQEGYFGIDQQNIDWDFWGRQTFGHGRLLGGLVQYYHLTKNKRALDAACQLGDYFVKKIPSWTTAFEDNPWSNKNDWVTWQDEKSNRQHFLKTHQTSILESLMMLYEIYPKQEYLDAGYALVDLFPDFGQYHSHSYMNTMAGMAMLYNHTKNHKVFCTLFDLYWQKVMKYGYKIDGGIREWFPDDFRTEGCSITDWIRLNLFMWTITTESVYLDEAENALINALYFHQTANGAFGHAVCTPDGYDSQYAEAWWCCTMHGLWAFADIINFSAVSKKDELWLNFYLTKQFGISISDKEIQFTLSTKYPHDGNILMTCETDQPITFITHLRIPQWADNFTIKVNEKTITGTFEKSIFAFERTWTSGDKLELILPFDIRVVDMYGNNFLKQRELSDDIYSAYLYYGPLLLAVDKKHNEKFPEVLIYDKNINYQTKGTDDNFEIGTAHFYIPAQSENREYTAILTPMSEQTGFEQWTDEWKNFVRNGEKPLKRQEIRIRHQIQFKKQFGM